MWKTNLGAASGATLKQSYEDEVILLQETT
jgi:hypothetical protein